MVLHVAICDDEEIIGFQVEGYIKEVCSKLNIQVEPDVYFCGEELCKKLKAGVCYDMIFLDIELKNINGIQVGMEIRNTYNDERTQIVYISGRPQYAMQLFDINPLNFLVKQISLEKVEKVIHKYLKISDFWTDVFTYYYGHDTFKVKIRDILYLKSKGKKITMYLRDGTDEFYGSLEDIFNTQLKKYDFMFIHKSYIVNYDYVSVFEYDRLILTDKSVLPIGQTRRKEIRKIQKEIELRRG